MRDPKQRKQTLVDNVNSLITLHGLYVGSHYDPRYPAGQSKILYTIYRKLDNKVVSKSMLASGLKRWYAGFVAAAGEAGGESVEEVEGKSPRWPLDVW